MNTNRINNKNLKRIAITAGTTAAALFLAAGLVACDGKASEKVIAPAEAAKVVDVLQNLAAEVLPATEDVAVAEAPAAPVAESKNKSTTQAAKKVAKPAKKKPASTGGNVASATPTVTESSPTPEVAAAPAPQTSETTVVSVPADQPAVQQPAVQQPAADQTAAVASDAPAAQQPTASTSTSNTSTWFNIPKIIGTPNLASQFQGATAADLTAPKISIACIPGYTC
ncbi:MAG: hypothetical protein ACKO3L_03425 [Actinomycetota bacterium]